MKIKIKHPRLKNAQLSLADGLVYINSEGVLEGDLSDAQIKKASLMNWEIIEEKPKRKKRKAPSKKEG